MPQTSLFESVERIFAEDDRGRMAYTPGFVDTPTAIGLIRDYGHRFRVLSARGPRIVVAGRGRRYLRSVGDGSRRNNLRTLPEC